MAALFFTVCSRQRMRFDGLGLQTVFTTFLFINSDRQNYLPPMGMVNLPLSVIFSLIDEVNRRHLITINRSSNLAWEDCQRIMGISTIRQTEILTSAEESWSVQQLVIINADFRYSHATYVQLLMHQDWPLYFLLSPFRAMELGE